MEKATSLSYIILLILTVTSGMTFNQQAISQSASSEKSIITPHNAKQFTQPQPQPAIAPQSNAASNPIPGNNSQQQLAIAPQRHAVCNSMLAAT